jgi:hypothetical protein
LNKWLFYPPLPLPGGENPLPTKERIPLMGGGGVGIICKKYIYTYLGTLGTSIDR